MFSRFALLNNCFLQTTTTTQMKLKHKCMHLASPVMKGMNNNAEKTDRNLTFIMLLNARLKHSTATINGVYCLHVFVVFLFNKIQP